jgi:hypothetical protein
VERPTFVACATADRMEFLVRVAWRGGVQARVHHFGRLEDAQRWIKRESENWLRMRSEAAIEAEQAAIAAGAGPAAAPTQITAPPGGAVSQRRRAPSSAAAPALPRFTRSACPAGAGGDASPPP